MLEILKKILAGMLGLILYPLVTIVSALVHLIGFACCILTGALLFPSLIASLNVFGELLRQYHLFGTTEDVSLNEPFISYLARDLGLRIVILAAGTIGLVLYSLVQIMLVLRSPFEGIRTGFKGGFDGLLSGIKNKLFNPFGIDAIVNAASRQDPNLLATLQTLARTGGINLEQLAQRNPVVSELPLTELEINQLTYRIPSSGTGYDNAVASWRHKLSRAEEATCCICLDIPTQNNIVLLQRQYFHNNTWTPIENETWVFSHSDLKTHLTTRDSKNPLNRANLRDNTSKHTHEDEACDTRWRIIPFCDQNRTLANKLWALRAYEQAQAYIPTVQIAWVQAKVSTIRTYASSNAYALFNTIASPFQTPTTVSGVELVNPDEEAEENTSLFDTLGFSMDFSGME
jgi:hypothetical protein